MARLTRLTRPRLPPPRARLLAGAEAVSVFIRAAHQDLEGEMSGIDVGGGDSLDASLEAPEVRGFARRGGGGGYALATPCSTFFFSEHITNTKSMWFVPKNMGAG